MLVLIAGKSKEFNEVSEAKIQQAREKIESLGAEGQITRTHTVDGTEAVEMVVTASNRGFEGVVYTLAVPKGMEGLVVSYMVRDESGDSAGWAQLKGSVRYSPGPAIPTWVWMAAGGVVLLFLLLTLRPRTAPARRVATLPGHGAGFGDLASRPLGADPSMGARGPSAAAVPPPPSPVVRAPEPAPQIPGLRSTLPPSGRWGK